MGSRLRFDKDLLQLWLENEVRETVEHGDPQVTAEYILELLSQDMNSDELKSTSVELLEDILKDATAPFVDRLFDVLEDGSYKVLIHRRSPSSSRSRSPSPSHKRGKRRRSASPVRDRRVDGDHAATRQRLEARPDKRGDRQSTWSMPTGMPPPRAWVPPFAMGMPRGMPPRGMPPRGVPMHMPMMGAPPGRGPWPMQQAHGFPMQSGGGAGGAGGIGGGVGGVGGVGGGRGGGMGRGGRGGGRGAAGGRGGSMRQPRMDARGSGRGRGDGGFGGGPRGPRPEGGMGAGMGGGEGPGASGGAPGEDDDKTTLRVWNIPERLLSFSKLSSHFERIGKVVNVLLRPKHSVAYVQFADHTSAAKALASTRSVCNNRFIRVSWAKHDPSAPDGVPTEEQEPAPAPAHTAPAPIRVGGPRPPRVRAGPPSVPPHVRVKQLRQQVSAMQASLKTQITLQKAMLVKISKMTTVPAAMKKQFLDKIKEQAGMIQGKQARIAELIAEAKVAEANLPSPRVGQSPRAAPSPRAVMSPKSLSVSKPSRVAPSAPSTPSATPAPSTPTAPSAPTVETLEGPPPESSSEVVQESAAPAAEPTEPAPSTSETGLSTSTLAALDELDYDAE